MGFSRRWQVWVRLGIGLPQAIFWIAFALGYVFSGE